MLVSRKTFWICVWAYAGFKVVWIVLASLFLIQNTFIDSLYPGIQEVVRNYFALLGYSTLAGFIAHFFLEALLIYFLLNPKLKSFVKEWVFAAYLANIIILLPFFFFPLNFFFLLALGIDLLLLMIWYRNYPSFMLASPLKTEEGDPDKQKVATVSKQIFVIFKTLLIVLCILLIIGTIFIITILQNVTSGRDIYNFLRSDPNFTEELASLGRITSTLGISIVSLYFHYACYALFCTFFTAVFFLKNVDTRLKDWTFGLIAYWMLQTIILSLISGNLFEFIFSSIFLLISIIWYRNYKYYDYGKLITQKAV